MSDTLTAIENPEISISPELFAKAWARTKMAVTTLILEGEESGSHNTAIYPLSGVSLWFTFGKFATAWDLFPS